MRRLPIVLVCGLLAAGCGSDDPAGEPAPSDASWREALAGAPAPLAGLHRQANELLEGGPDAFEGRLRELRGHPVVVNKWASWCGPCRAEFPYFRKQALTRGKRVAFLGVNSNDNDAAARKFLREHPVPYPSYEDPNLGIAALFKGVQAFPVTAFYDSKGKLAFVHQGGYPSNEKLAEDIDRYAR
jgi:cytochrome c biogenesis protein CcmG, thiol:disulfide interchange protein DsbE